jgi:hypothetical protein
MELEVVAEVVVEVEEDRGRGVAAMAHSSATCSAPTNYTIKICQNYTSFIIPEYIKRS